MTAFDTDITTYQGDTTNVFAAGLPAASWVNNAILNVGGATKHIYVIDLASSKRIRQTGYIYGGRVLIDSYLSGNLVSFIVLRKDGTTYDLVGESEDFAVTGKGTLTASFTSPIACIEGDYFGVVFKQGAAATQSPKGTVKTLTGGSIGYKQVDIEAADNAPTVLENYTLNAEAFTHRPYICGTGDSIMAGHTSWYTFYEATFGGTITHNPLYQVTQLNSNVLHQNHAMGATTFAWALATGVVSALAVDPKYLIIHSGINDIAQAREWSAVLSDLNAIKVLCDAAGTVLILDEILPWTAGSDAQAVTIRTWNANLASWCTSNSVHLIEMHDSFGKIRVSTGELDDLADAYNSDGVHVTLAGKQLMADFWVDYLSGLYSDGTVLLINMNGQFQSLTGGMRG
jgi:lysophospholipase L1-like esterase